MPPPLQQYPTPAKSGIIDYASPASRSSLRLPAQSVIDWRAAPGRLVVRQVLSGREGALWALGLAGLSFVVMVSIGYGLTAKWRRNIEQIALLGGLAAAEIVVGTLVVNNTWRKTILTVTKEEMELEFIVPLSATQRFRFPSEQIAAVSVVDRDALPGEAIVAEMEIRMWSVPAVRLFAGHPPALLGALVMAILEVQPPAPPPQLDTT